MGRKTETDREVLLINWDIPILRSANNSQVNSWNLEKGCSKLFVKVVDPSHSFCLSL